VIQHVDALLPHGCCISLLELFVKIDTAGRIWLLHSGAVKTHLYTTPSPRSLRFSTTNAAAVSSAVPVLDRGHEQKQCRVSRARPSLCFCNILRRCGLTLHHALFTNTRWPRTAPSVASRKKMRRA
jgi:hypothetical protein